MLGLFLFLKLASMASLFVEEVLGTGEGVVQQPSRSARSSQDTEDLEKVKAQLELVTKLSLDSKMKVRIIKNIVMLCPQSTTESQPVTDGKAAVQLFFRKQKALQENGQPQSHIEEMLVEPTITVNRSAVAMMIETLKDTQNMEKLKDHIRAHWPQPLTRQWEWIVEQVPHLKIPDVNDAEYKRQEMCLLKGTLLMDGPRPEGEKSDCPKTMMVKEVLGAELQWTPTAALLIVVGHFSKEKAKSNQRGPTIRGSLKRKLQEHIHNPQEKMGD